MRTITSRPVIGGETFIFSLKYPDEVVFVFNPLFMEITLEESSMVSCVQIEFLENKTGATKEIEVKLYRGTARVYISRIFELFFDNVMHERLKTVSVQIKHGDSVYANVEHLVIWGSMAVGERFDSYGLFRHDDKRPYLNRTRVWFKNFPFTVSFYQSPRPSMRNVMRARYDQYVYDRNIILQSPAIIGVRSLTDEEYQKALNASCPIDKTLNGVVFVEGRGRFVGVYEDNLYCGLWGSQVHNILDNTFYNTEEGARTDIEWGNTVDQHFYRYDSLSNGLVKSEIGFYGECGLFELHPAFSFPDAEFDVTYRQDSPNSHRFSTFDETFDYTFFELGEFDTITRLIVCNDTCGYYIRWIDRFGCFQYYLFKSGDTTIKNKLSGNVVSWQIDNRATDFPNHMRDINITATDTRKCQANSIPDEIFSYVSSIITSPIIDLYLGKTKLGEEIWVPVNIVASSHKYNPKDVLHNLEISFTMPGIQAQSL